MAQLERTVDHAGPAVRPWESQRERGAWSPRAVSTYVVLSLFLLLAIGPFIIIVLAAFKTDTEIARNVFGLPEVWRWSNIGDAWREGHFAQYFRSSIIVVVPVVVVSCLLSIMTGYAFGRMRFPLSRVLFFLILLGLMIPGEAVIIPLYHNLRWMDLLDTYWAMILPDIAFSVSFGTLWMRGFFSEVPRGSDRRGDG